MPTSTHPLDDGFLNLILPIPIDAAGKLKQMLGWKTLVDNYEMSFGLLMILNEQRAHIATTKKEYDDLMKILLRVNWTAMVFVLGMPYFSSIKSGLGSMQTENWKLCVTELSTFLLTTSTCVNCMNFVVWLRSQKKSKTLLLRKELNITCKKASWRCCKSTQRQSGMSIGFQICRQRNYSWFRVEWVKFC